MNIFWLVCLIVFKIVHVEKKPCITQALCNDLFIASITTMSQKMSPYSTLVPSWDKNNQVQLCFNWV